MIYDETSEIITVLHSPCSTHRAPLTYLTSCVHLYFLHNTDSVNTHSDIVVQMSCRSFVTLSNLLSVYSDRAK